MSYLPDHPLGDIVRLVQCRVITGVKYPSASYRSSQQVIEAERLVVWRSILRARRLACAWALFASKGFKGLDSWPLFTLRCCLTRVVLQPLLMYLEVVTLVGHRVLHKGVLR